MLWVWFMDLVPPYSFWGPGSGPLRKSFSFNESLESKREGLTKQALLLQEHTLAVASH